MENNCTFEFPDHIAVYVISYQSNLTTIHIFSHSFKRNSIIPVFLFNSNGLESPTFQSYIDRNIGARTPQKTAQFPHSFRKPLPAILSGTLHPFLATLGLFESEAPKEGRNAYDENSSANTLLRCCCCKRLAEGLFCDNEY